MPARQPWSILVLLCVAQFMVVLDITVVNVALPSIDADLGFGGADLQWVVTAYVLLAGGFLLLGGRAADLLGRKEVFLAGLLLFVVASLASGLAGSPEALIASRAVQGLGAAMLTPSALSIIVTTYTGPQHAPALSAWGAIASAGAAAGMLLGGMLTTWLSWEWVFLVNVPVGLTAAVLAWRMLPSERPEASWRGQLDLPGAGSVVAGLAVLVYALEGAADHGWGSARTVLLLVAAAALLAGFGAVERRAPRPLVPPSTWRSRSLVAGAALMLGATGLLVGAFFLNSIHLQTALEMSPLETGLAFLPIAVAIGFAAHATAHLLPRLGTRVVVVTGLGLTAAAAFLLAAAPVDAGYATDLLPGFLLLGVGVGLVFPAVNVAAMTGVDHHGAGLSSGLMATAHEVGAALGVAVLAAVGDYADGFVVAGIAAGVMAAAASVVLPAVRPAVGTPIAVH